MPQMGKTEEDWNGLKLGFLKTVQPNSFSKLISAVCNFKNNAQETYLFVSNLWLWGRVIGKIRQNELDCRDTAPLIWPLDPRIPFDRAPVDTRITVDFISFFLNLFTP